MKNSILNFRIINEFLMATLGYANRDSVSPYLLACEGLASKGLPKPLGRADKSWVAENETFICDAVGRKYTTVRGKPAIIPRNSELAAEIARSGKAKKIKAARSKEFCSKVDAGTWPANSSFLSSDKFLSSFAWRQVRMKALIKHGRRCLCCGASPADGAVMNVDHVKPRKLFPELALDVDNLQVLCHDCNHGKGNWDQTDWRS